MNLQLILIENILKVCHLNKEILINLSFINIELAKELSSLIEERMNNTNFQLIIITHDKDFVRELSEHSDNYYKVYKVS